MSCKYFLVFLFLLLSNFLIAQTEAIKKQLENFESSSNHEAAITGLNKLLAVEKLTPQDKLAVQSKLVSKYQQLQKWDTCLSYCQAQVTLAHQQNNSLAEATFYKLIANTYYHIPDKEKAVDYWEKCISISEQYNYSILLEQCYHNIGAVNLENHANLDVAEQYFLKSLKLGLINNKENSTDNNRHYRLLATLYTVTNQLQKAEQLYLEVIEKNKIIKDTAQLAEALMFYSEVLNKENKFEKATQISAEALTLSKKINQLDMTQTALGFYSRHLYSSGNYKAAYEAKDELEQIIRTRFNGDLNNKVSEAEAKFKNAEIEHEKEIALVKAKKEMQIYILAFISFLAIAGFALNFWYQKRNVKQKLQMQLQVQDEKERLSRDLHDNLGSQMALLSNNIESLDTNYKKQNSIDDNIENVKGTSKQLLQTLRGTIWILNREQISTEDFFNKFIDHAHRYIQAGNGMRLQVNEDFVENKILNSNEALQLFRICQEAITNACKYSNSEILKIIGKVTNNKLTICIADNGKGFDVAKINSTEHYGLKNMAKRAASINAVFKIDTGEGKGVLVTVIL